RRRRDRPLGDAPHRHMGPSRPPEAQAPARPPGRAAAPAVPPARRRAPRALRLRRRRAAREREAAHGRDPRAGALLTEALVGGQRQELDELLAGQRDRLEQLAGLARPALALEPLVV